MLKPKDLDPLLRCPLCGEQLDNPTTLHCGHSLCSHHLEHPSSSCPAPACSQSPATPAGPRIPPESTVQFTAAPNPVHPEHIPIPDHRSDVTLNKVIALANRTDARLRPLSPPCHDNDSDDEDQDDDDARPRKRHKRHHADSDDEEENEHQETPLLQHLIAAATRDRLVPPDEPLIPDNNSILAEFDKKLLEELTCHICYVLYYQPVTTPCQHTYCAKCLQRSLDHNTSCPICRQELPSYYFHDQPINKSILSIILKAYPLLYQERRLAFEEEERHGRLDTPIFQATLSFPGVPTLLHFFEPRYRLMLRRCLESPHPRFGMIMSPKPGAPQTDYGTILEIRSVQMLPDGRSMVETWGSTRFRILDRGTLDGYMVGKIETIYDYPDDITETLVIEDDPQPVPSPPPSSSQPLLSRITSTLTGSSSRATLPSSSTSPSSPSTSTSTASSAISPPSTPRSTSPSANAPASTPARPRQPTNAELMDTCKAFLDRLQRGAAPWVVQRLSSTYGAMPSEPALFSFWVALVLPIEEHEKAKLLPIRSARLRLMLVVHWIEQLNNNWYAWVLLSVIKANGWVGHPASPVLPCMLWIAFMLMVSRLIGWI